MRQVGGALHLFEPRKGEPHDLCNEHSRIHKMCPSSEVLDIDRAVKNWIDTDSEHPRKELFIRGTLLRQSLDWLFERELIGYGCGSISIDAALYKATNP